MGGGGGLLEGSKKSGGVSRSLLLASELNSLRVERGKSAAVRRGECRGGKCEFRVWACILGLDLVYYTHHEIRVSFCD